MTREAATRFLLGLAALALALCLPEAVALAMPANPLPVDLTQPDGTPITLRISGDERFNWFEDLNGYTVVIQDGVYVYAQLDQKNRLSPTTVAVGKTDPALAGLTPGILPPANVVEQIRNANGAVAIVPEPTAPIPAIGTVKNLVILCLFNDQTIATHGRPAADYDVLFNAVGGNQLLCPTGSVRDVYTENSYGLLTLNSTIAAWVTLPHTEAYYANGVNGLGRFYPTDVQRMVEDALTLVDPLVNFGDFDQNNDGYVDGIDIIHSGHAAETGGGGGNWIWSQKWVLDEVPGGHWTSADNNSNNEAVKVYDFHTEAALWGQSGTGITRIGVVSHETGHFFGLPDLYDTDYSSFGAGSYCMMANSWGFIGDQFNPPHFSAWCKVKLGWVTPIAPTGPATVTLRQVETFPDICYVGTGYPGNSYLLIENRQPTGLEPWLPGPGLAVWHIDELQGNNDTEGYPGQPGWPGNNKHYKVALLQADGFYDLEHKLNQGDFTDLYRFGDVTRIDAGTVPSTLAYQGGVTTDPQTSISNVSASGPTMTFRYGRDVWVDFGYVGAEIGTFFSPFNTLAEGVNAVAVGGNVVCKGGVTGERPLLNKVMFLKTSGGTTTIGQ